MWIYLLTKKREGNVDLHFVSLITTIQLIKYVVCSKKIIGVFECLNCDKINSLFIFYREKI